MELPDPIFWSIIAVLIAVLAGLVYYGMRQRQLVRIGLEALKKKQTSAYNMGINEKSGDLSQVLGTFSVLTKYDEVLLLSSTSRQSSLDLLGIKDNRLDFIEFKKEGGSLSPGQSRLRKMIESGQAEVKYNVIDVRLPDGTEIKSRK